MASKAISAVVSDPYAEALMSIAQANGLEDHFGDELRGFLWLLRESEDFEAFLANPLLKPEDKKAVIRRLAGDGVNPLLVNFLQFLVDRRRIIFLESIANKYLELLRKLRNAVLAEVISASELNDHQRAELTEKVKAMTGATYVELNVKVDPSLLGGVIVKVGSQVLDASLRGQLRRISINLTSAG
jgi:F-type H+-transporting ATPase subunit delta